jgi:hypothetical protein
MPQQDNRPLRAMTARHPQHKSPFANRMPLARLLAGLFLLFSMRTGTRAQGSPEELLSEVRDRVMATVRRLPKYVCTETVDRTRYEPFDPVYGTNGIRHRRSCDETVAKARRGSKFPCSADRLRLDVAVEFDGPSRENEMYSWAGENRFSDVDLFEFVHDGAISTGNFASMLASIFGNDGARFFYAGDKTGQGGPVSEFGFHVAHDQSQYLYIYGDHLEKQARLAFNGTAFADPRSSDLIRLRVETEELPDETGVCELTRDVAYGHFHMSGSEFLLPVEAKISAIHSDGSVAENRIRYSACREFRGDSSVRFEAAPEPDGSGKTRNAPDSRLSLPSGLPFKVVFTDRIDPASAAAGDPIRGRLKTAIRDASETVLVPEGTLVTGRILSVRRFYHIQTLPAREQKRTDLRPSLVVAIRLESLEINGALTPVKATYDSGPRRFAQSGPFSVRVDIGSLDELHRAPSASETAVFDFWDNDPEHAVKRGLESSWITAAH